MIQPSCCTHAFLGLPLQVVVVVAVVVVVVGAAVELVVVVAAAVVVVVVVVVRLCKAIIGGLQLHRGQNTGEKLRKNNEKIVFPSFS